MLINATPSIMLLRTFRIATWSGRFGGGKTSCAYRMAAELMAHHGYRYLLSNCEDVWSDSIDDIVPRPDVNGEPTYLDTVIILDEAGIVLFDNKHAREFVAFMRKFNVVLLLPSVEKPPGRVRHLVFQRRFHLDPLGIPLWWYQVKLNTGMEHVDYAFWWWRPSEIFGIYDTTDIPSDDAGISDFLIDHTRQKLDKRNERLGSKKHRRNARGAGSVSYGTVPQLVVPGGEAADTLSDAAEELAETLSAFQLGQANQKRRGRRR